MMSLDYRKLMAQAFKEGNPAAVKEIKIPVKAAAKSG
jgi:hypothetical protein